MCNYIRNVTASRLLITEPGFAVRKVRMGFLMEKAALVHPYQCHSTNALRSLICHAGNEERSIIGHTSSEV